MLCVDYPLCSYFLLYYQVRSAIAELKNAVRVFSQLSAASSYHAYGFDEKKMETHVEYCKHLLDAAKVHCEAAEHEEQQTRQRLEVARQVSLAEEARRKAEEQRKFQACFIIISYFDLYIKSYNFVAIA